MQLTKSSNASTRTAIGAVLWVASVQFYIMQFLVAQDWPKLTPYSWAQNTISDLGSALCGEYSERFVCSPSYEFMNISFVILGFTMVSGALLLRSALAKQQPQDIGILCLAVAGVGSMLVGIFPQETNGGLHAIGAGLAFLLGNIGVILVGSGLDTRLRLTSFMLGGIGLYGLLLFVSGQYLGLGIGGMERIAAYPQSIWMIIIGSYLLATSHKSATLNIP
jgi:hypothetical membrane protein